MHFCTAPASVQAAVQWTHSGLRTCHTFAVLRIRAVLPVLRIYRMPAVLPAPPRQILHFQKSVPSLQALSVLFFITESAFASVYVSAAHPASV